MVHVHKIKENPFFVGNRHHQWEGHSVFNPCVVKEKKKVHMLYRAQSSYRPDKPMQSISSIGYAYGEDGIQFGTGRQLIAPELDWEKYGCEDPRVTFFEGKYYVFYTALSGYPFTYENIKAAVCLTKDFETIESKKLVTPFNAKAMTLFPERINGKMSVLLTVNTDKPPAKICFALLEQDEDLYSTEFWLDWYNALEENVLTLLRKKEDHVEVGAPPLKTDRGWLVVYCYIQNYFSSERIFGIEAALLDFQNPLNIIAKTTEPLIFPSKKYELVGDLPNIVFPSGAIIEGEELFIYYGASDTVCCLAKVNLEELLNNMTVFSSKSLFMESTELPQGLRRYKKNPIMEPRLELHWEDRGTFNPAAIYLGGKVHMLYRAQSNDDVSTFGYANSENGFDFENRTSKPVYVPRANFERKGPGISGFSGCEDPRLTCIDETVYVLYTGFDGITPRVVLSSISVQNFIDNNWSWSWPTVISPPGIADKNACILPKKINGRYLIFHRAGNSICLSYVDNLDFNGVWLGRDDNLLLKPLKAKIPVQRAGIVGPPIETPQGWLLFYHFIANPHSRYCIGAVMLDLNNPKTILSQKDAILLTPEMDYEKKGYVDNVVFSCGVVLVKDDIFLYYGGGDKVLCVATMKLEEVLGQL